MNTIATRRPLWPRIKARFTAARLRAVIRSHEREYQSLMDALDAIPREIDGVADALAELRVQLALAERGC